MAALTPEAEEYLAGRGISSETAEKHQLTGQRMDRGGSVLATPYFRDGKIVNTKFRAFSLSDPEVKSFWMQDEGELCLWNRDILLDPLLCLPDHPLVITEGEIDGLSVDEAGHQWVVSVPNGAQQGTKWLDADMPHIRKAAKFVLAVDNDDAGETLKRALLNALSLPRCHLVSYPDGCKDLNDVLKNLGKEAVLKVIAEARPIPYQGAYYASDFDDFVGHQTYDLGIRVLDACFTPFAGGFIVITGTPGTGKSLLVQALCYLLAKKHGLKSVIGTFENEPPQVIEELCRMYCGTRPMTYEIRQRAKAWINRHFYFAVTDAPESAPHGEEPVETNLAWFLDAASTFIIREGAKVVVIDPWNELEHSRRHGESETQYIARSIREMKRWARRYNVILIVIGHPTKLEYDKKDKTFRKPTLYDIAGSAAWFDKADIGIVLTRTGERSEIELDVQKVRFKDTGRRGQPVLVWNEAAARYESASIV